MLALLLLQMLPLPGASPETADVRIGHWPDRTRLVIETGAGDVPAFEIRTVNDQAFIRLSGVDDQRLATSLDQLDLVQEPAIRRFRTVSAHESELTLILDLAADVRAELFELSPQAGHGHRLVLDLHTLPLSEPDPLKEIQPASSTTAAPERLPPVPDGDDVVLTAIRVGDWEDRTRLVLETRQPLPFQLMPPSTGQQLVVTLEGLKAAALAEQLRHQLQPDHPLVQGVAVDEAQPGQARLELTLSRPAEARIFNLAPENGQGHRLVLDLLLVDDPEAPGPAVPRQEPGRPPEERTASPPPPPSAPDPSGPAETQLWLDARLNAEQGSHSVLALRLADGRLLLSEGDLGRWPLRPADAARETYFQESWYSLDALGIEYELDSRRMTLEMQAPARLFASHALPGVRRERLQPTSSRPGAFINYDYSLSHSDGDSRGTGLFELGVFNGWGSGTTSALSRHGGNISGEALTRMDSRWRRDSPERMRTLVLGDTITGGTEWSGNARIGGVQWGSNFSTQPELITMPTMSLAGEAVLPSTVDLYVDGALRQRQQVTPGPFLVDEVPVISGAGEVRLVVTDALGREQVISRDYYASQRMLRRGLHEWTWNAGFIRRNYGLESFDYGRGIVAATHRYGFSDRLTGEFHAQALDDHRTGGAGASVLVPGGGVVHGAVAYSDGDRGSGHFYSLGAQRHGRRFSAGIEGQASSADFHRLGSRTGRSLPARQLRTHGSMRLPTGGSLSLSYTSRQYRQTPDIDLVTLRLSHRLGNLGFMSISALRFLETDETAISATLSIPLGLQRTNVSVTGAHRNSNTQGAVIMQRSLPAGTGYGYRLRMGMGDNKHHLASVAYQNDHGSWQLEGAQRGGQHHTRATASGGLAWLGGGMYTSRRIHDSFAVVEVPGFEGVRVLSENQVVARTNAQGRALVPRLRAYERNRLRIDQADLPLNARVGHLDTEVAPYYRSGVLVAFPVTRTRDAFFRVELESGEPLPLGSALFDDQGEQWPVGHRGETFMTNLNPENRIRARYNGKVCEFDLPVPLSDEPVPDLGTVTCMDTDQ